MNVSELGSSEYHPYYGPYILALGDVSLADALHQSLESISNLFDQISEEKLNFSYADGKWTVAEVLVHLMDAERVFQYRALRFARNDSTELQGFDQDLYVPESGANQRSKEQILEEFLSIRKSSVSLFQSLGKTELLRLGKANGASMSVRALGFVICGHQAHHFKILKERYLQ